METKWGITGKSGRIEMGEGYRDPPPCTVLLKVSLLYFVWTARLTILASNLGDFLLCDFQIKYCNPFIIRHFSLLWCHSLGQTFVLFGDHRLDKGISDILLVPELFVLIPWLETALKTDVCPPFPQLSSPKIPKPS